jgi:hypothetical protein
MTAVRERAEGLVRHGASLADRGAYFSARAEFIQALRAITQALDAQGQSAEHSQALAEGLRALDEADDFCPRGSELEANLDLASVVAAHRTPVLKDENLDGMTALAALQRYYGYAQSRLASAAGNEAAASQALFSMGKLTTVMAERRPEDRRLFAPKAMALHQAALLADASNYRAANELGVLLATFGQFDEAKRLLVQSATAAPQADTWHNLAVVHERLGERDLAGKARYEMELAQRSRSATGGGKGVEWVDPAAFAKSSPAPGAVPVATRPAAPAIKAASSGKNVWLK